MCDEEASTTEQNDEFHLEWWYDLDQHFLGNVSLLNARPSYATELETDDGTFPATVHLPINPENAGGLANFLAPPADWAATPKTAEESWGTCSRTTALGFEGVAVKRLAFNLRTASALTPLDLRAEGYYLLAQQILLHIDTWWDNVKTWLEITTNQRLAQIGHVTEDLLNPYTRASVWAVDNDTGQRDKLQIGGTMVRGPDRVLPVTPEALQDCVALATTPPPPAWTLLRDARSLQNDYQMRRSVIDAATAADLAAAHRIELLLAGETDQARRKKLTGAKTSALGGKVATLRKFGDEDLPADLDTLIKTRNGAVHDGFDVRWDKWEPSFLAALELVEHTFPLPTAPGSGRKLQCYWSHALLPSTVPRLSQPAQVQF